MNIIIYLKINQLISIWHLEMLFNKEKNFVLQCVAKTWWSTSSASELHTS